MNLSNDSINDDILLWGSATTTIILLIILTIYIIKWWKNGVKILKILCILLANQVGEGIFETINSIDEENKVLCIIGLIGELFFTIATQYWIIFITRLIYRQALTPGKYFNIMKIFFNNIALTYLPSLVVSVAVLFIILVNNSKSEQLCWKILIQANVADTIVYFISFILPSLIGVIAVLFYFCCFTKIKNKSWTNYLLFPLFSVIFSLYYLTIKLFLYFQQTQARKSLQIPLLIEPLCYGLLFIYIAYVYSKNQKNINSDLTIRDSQIQDSFIENL